MTARSIGEVLKRRQHPDKVRAHSYDVDDKRADVFRPVGNGSKHDGLRWRDSLLTAVEEWNIQFRVAGKGVPLPGAFIRVLKAYLSQLDFATGRLDPPLNLVAKLAGCCKDTVVRALRKFRDLRILDWVRRSIKTDNAPGEGPTRKQTTSAYVFTISQGPKRLLARFRELLERKRLRARHDGISNRKAAERADLAAKAAEAPRGSKLWSIQQSLDRLGGALLSLPPESEDQSVSPIQHLREKD
jgi:hypothetical protein